MSFKGKRVVDRRWGRTTADNVSASYKKEKIIQVATRSCRILHGSYSWLATGLKNVFTFGATDAIEHWWMIIETKYKYYMIQFRGNVGNYGLIEMRECTTWRDCNLSGLAEANKDSSADVFCESKYSYKWSSGYTSTKTIGDVINYLDSFNANYSLLNNNCQDLCRKLYRWL